VTAAVETITGTIDSGGLGRTLMHEHVFITSPELLQNYPEMWNEEEEVAKAITKLRELKAHGIDSIVDLTVIGLGRYIPRVQRVAAEVDINIVVATGLYTYNDVPMFVHFRGPGTIIPGPDLLEELFVRDITEGIADTGVKASILKCATDKQGVTPGVDRVLRAVAHTHRATGVPISTHTDAETKRGLEQQEIFRQEGVDLGRVVIGHSGDTTDLDYLQQLIDNGSYIGMDRFSMGGHVTFDDRVDTVAALCRRGHADRMVLSHDTMCFSDWFPDFVLDRLPAYTHIPDDVLPALRERGVTDEQIETMLVDNPRRIFENRGAY
jgi:phosphotriesterase-related protein